MAITREIDGQVESGRCDASTVANDYSIGRNTRQDTGDSHQTTRRHQPQKESP